MELRGRAALVTGGAGGLGTATCRHLVALGMRVVVFNRTLDKAEALAAELGPDAVAAGGDANDDEAVQAAVDAACALGPLSLSVYAAGGWDGGGRTVARDGTPHDAQEFAATMAMNAFGTFNVARLAAAAMRTNEPNADGERGVIVNTSSIAGVEGQAGQVAYAAAKAAIMGMTLPMARDLAPLGIRVVTVAPGIMDTHLMEVVPDPIRDRLVGETVFPKRMGYPSEFALMVESIATNPYLNGGIIRLDGGLRMPPQ